MKLRNLLFALAITFTGLGFSACSDESENIIPQPVNSDDAAATVGNEGERDDHM